MFNFFKKKNVTAKPESTSKELKINSETEQTEAHNAPEGSKKAENEKNELRVVASLYDTSQVIGGLEWYKKRYNGAMKIVFVQCIGIIILLLLNVVLIMNKPSPKYFATSTEGKIIDMVPLDKPVLTQAGLLNWTSEAVTNTFTLSFLHWKDQLNAARVNYSAEAFKSFLESMKENGIINTIESKRLSVAAVINKAPVIIASGVVEGRATWKIEVPLTISYESSRGVEITQKLLATVMVQRTNTLVQPRGIEISQIILNRDSGTNSSSK